MSTSNDQLKNRLLGAILLVILAVLLIPLFLGEPKSTIDLPEPAVIGGQSDDGFESRIQSEEARQAAEKAVGEKEAVLVPVPSVSVPSKIQSEPLQVPAVSAKPKEPKTTTESKAPSPESAKQPPEPVVKLKPAPEPKAQPKPKVQAEPKPKPAPAVVKAAPVRNGWGVQVGAFSKSSNAQSIAKTLRGHGFTPNLSDYNASFGRATRVWLGPYADKKQATAAAGKLKKATGEAGFVKSYPFK